MNITVYAVGRIKEAFYADAVREFEKRMKRYCRLQIVEVSDEKTPDHASGGEVRQILEKEGGRLLKKIPDSVWLTALAINGKKRTSVGLADHLSDLALRGKSDLGFVIGGSLGLSDAVLARADETLSFSDMTFPHQLMRVMLLEQIYRSFRIIHHEPYHK